MTFVVLTLFGAGVIFIVSAVEGTSVGETLQKVMSGEKLDLKVK